MTIFARAVICSSARELKGLAWIHQGRHASVGVDCAGMVLYALKAAGIQLTDVRGYPRNPTEGLLLDVLDNEPALTRIPVATARPGDIFVMRFGRESRHLAIRTDCGIVHSYEKAGRVVEHRLSKVWRQRITRAYTIDSR